MVVFIYAQLTEEGYHPGNPTEAQCAFQNNRSYYLGANLFFFFFLYRFDKMSTLTKGMTNMVDHHC